MQTNPEMSVEQRSRILILTGHYLPAFKVSFERFSTPAYSVGTIKRKSDKYE